MNLRRLYLVLVPLLLLALMPASWRRLSQAWRERSWLLAIVACLVYLFALLLKYQYSQMRYFLPCMPFAYVWLAATLSDRERGIRQWEWVWLGVGLFLMITTGFVNTNLQPPAQVRVLPSLFYCLPFLWPWYI